MNRTTNVKTDRTIWIHAGVNLHLNENEAVSIERAINTADMTAFKAIVEKVFAEGRISLDGLPYPQFL